MGRAGALCSPEARGERVCWRWFAALCAANHLQTSSFAPIEGWGEQLLFFFPIPFTLTFFVVEQRVYVPVEDGRPGENKAGMALQPRGRKRIQPGQHPRGQIGWRGMQGKDQNIAARPALCAEGTWSEAISGTPTNPASSTGIPAPSRRLGMKTASAIR